jgi:hypothetical protein
MTDKNEQGDSTMYKWTFQTQSPLSLQQLTNDYMKSASSSRSSWHTSPTPENKIPH